MSLTIGLGLLACSGDAPPTEDSAAPSDSAPGEDSRAPADTAPEGPRPRLMINELMADNGGSLTTDLGATPDWLELYNPGEQAIPLEGWGLSDDPEAAPHVFEAGLMVPARGYVLLYADGSASQGHVPFRLSAEGEALAVFDPEGWRSDQVRFGAQAEDIAAARVRDGDEAAGWEYVLGGTPGTSNER